MKDDTYGADEPPIVAHASVSALRRAKRPAPPKHRRRKRTAKRPVTTPVTTPSADLWPEPVDDGAAVLAEMTATVRRFMSLLPEGADAMALWSVFAHALDAFDHNPLLLLNSPVKGCGKTTALSIVADFTPRAVMASNITDASVFRYVDEERPTLLADEMDSMSEEKRASLVNIFNASHYRKGAFVIRCVGENHKPTKFSTWTPYALAQIGKIKPATLASRCITVPLRRKLPGERVERYRDGAIDDTLRRKAARWVRDHFKQLRACDPKMPSWLRDRDADNWRPLFAIAEVARGDWPARVRAAAKALTHAEDSLSDGERLLADIRTAFDQCEAERLSTKVLIRKLKDIEGSPWRDYGDSYTGLTEKRLGALLDDFGIRPNRKGSRADRNRGYDRADFEDAWQRYCPAE